jgi:hypothetical protein
MKGFYSMTKPTFVTLAVRDDEAYNRGDIHHVEYAGQSRTQALISMKRSLVNEHLFVLEERRDVGRDDHIIDNAMLFRVLAPGFPPRFQKFLIKNGEVL